MALNKLFIKFKMPTLLTKWVQRGSRAYFYLKADHDDSILSKPKKQN
jgi:predicted RNA-binding protein (virulence factor B family)